MDSNPILNIKIPIIQNIYIFIKVMIGESKSSSLYRVSKSKEQNSTMGLAIENQDESCYSLLGQSYGWSNSY